MSSLDLVIYGVLCLVANIFGGIAGGGAGFVTTPLLIFLGLSPAQAVASGKFPGLAVTTAGLQRLTKEKLHSWKTVVPMMILALIIGLTAPVFIKNLDSEFYRNTVGILLLVMIPVVLIKKVGHTKREVSSTRRALGWIFMAAALLLQAIFSSGMGTLVSLTLMSMLGMTALEASVTKRFSQLLLNIAIVSVLLGSGLIVWQVAVIGMVAAFIGGTIGVRLAIKKGNIFVSRIFAVFMLVAAVELIFG